MDKRQDPVRPAFVPVHKPGDTYQSEVIGWTQKPTDDGKRAIVEMVATSPAALQPVLSANSPDVMVFKRGKHGKDAVEVGSKDSAKIFR